MATTSLYTVSGISCSGGTIDQVESSSIDPAIQSHVARSSGLYHPKGIYVLGARPMARFVTTNVSTVLGYLGIHRFYVGKALSGLFWLLTGGIVGIGVVVDAVLILFNAFTDKHGKTLREWT